MTNNNRNKPAEQHNLSFHEPIDRWDEALPLGNGLLGCLVWGNGEPIRLSMDRADLWDTRLAPEAGRGACWTRPCMLNEYCRKSHVSRREGSSDAFGRAVI
ncbi:hypothetical protein FHS15_003895 [Paenibacillus castaneae]|nr:hypothetical protein [Paenibacillus castaneae]